MVANVDIPDMKLHHPLRINNNGLDAIFFSAEGVRDAASEIDEHGEVQLAGCMKGFRGSDIGVGEQKDFAACRLEEAHLLFQRFTDPYGIIIELRDCDEEDWSPDVILKANRPAIVGCEFKVRCGFPDRDARWWRSEACIDKQEGSPHRHRNQPECNQ